MRKEDKEISNNILLVQPLSIRKIGTQRLRCRYKVDENAECLEYGNVT